MRARAIQCQISAIGDHVLNSSLETNEMRNLAAALVDAARLLVDEAAERDRWELEFNAGGAA